MKKKDTIHKSIEEALIDLYLNIKIRKQDEIESCNAESLNEEKDKLRKTNPLTIIEYIKNSIDILIDLKVEEKLEGLKSINSGADKDENQNEYESLLRKLESDIRLHIKIEHQLKLHSEALQQKIEELEKDNEENKFHDLHIKDVKDKKDEEIQSLKSSISNLKQILKSYEEQSLKMSDIEKKFRSQNASHEKELKIIEERYNDKIKSLTKKIAQYEETLKINNFAYKSYNQEEYDFTKTTSHHDQNYDSSLTGKTNISSIEKKNDSESLKRNSENLKNAFSDLIGPNVGKANKNFNKKPNNTNYDRSLLTNKSYVLEENASMNDASKSIFKKNDLAKTLVANSKKLLNKDNFKTHTKTFSMEIKKDKSKSPATKSFNNYQDTLNLNNYKHSNKLLSNFTKNSNSGISNINNLIQHHSNYKTSKNSNLFNNHSTANFVTNKSINSSSQKNLANGNNNSNTYSTNNSHLKNDINLRNYLMNKINNNIKPGSTKGRISSNNNRYNNVPGHVRSKSNNIFG